MGKERNRKKKRVDYIIMGVFYAIFSPIIISYVITYGISKGLMYLIEKLLNPLYNTLCKIIRGPIPNSVVSIKGADDRNFHRINDKLLTIKEAKALGKEYEDKGYEVSLHLSEF